MLSRICTQAYKNNKDVRSHKLRTTGVTDFTFWYDLDNLVRKLINANIWSGIDVLMVVHDNESDTYLDIKNQSDFTKNNSPTFIANQGITSSGTNYILTGINENALTNLSLYNGHYAFYARDKNNDNTSYLSIYPIGHTIITDNGSGGNLMRCSTLQSSSAIEMNITTSTAPGFYIASVNSSNDRIARFKSSVATHTSTATGTLYANPIGLFGGSGSHEFAMWSIGSGLSDSQMLSYIDAAEEFATARGFNV